MQLFIEKYANSEPLSIELFSKRMKELRRMHNLTQAQPAKILGISKGTLAVYETGKRPISTPFVYKLCKEFSISADYLLGKIENQKI